MDNFKPKFVSKAKRGKREEESKGDVHFREVASNNEEDDVKVNLEQDVAMARNPSTKFGHRRKPQKTR